MTRPLALAITSFERALMRTVEVSRSCSLGASANETMWGIYNQERGMRMKTIRIVAIMVMSASAHAQVFKCNVDGKTVYQEKPCADGGGETVKIYNDGPSEIDQLRAENRRLREQMQYGSEGHVDPNVRYIEDNYRNIRRDDNQYRVNRDKAARCDELRRLQAENAGSNAGAEYSYQIMKAGCR